MANRLGYVVLLTALTSGVLVTACSDDDAITGGEAGEPGISGSPGDAGAGGSGGKGGSGGSSGSAGSSGSGGSSGGSVGGTAGQGPVGGTGSAGEAGAGGVAGAGETGGASGEGGGGGDGQAGAGIGGDGAGGAPELQVEYTCGSSKLTNKFCSAAASVTCSPATDCSDCVDFYETARADFATCAVCLAVYDAGLQCSVDAFEDGNAAAGVECFDGDGVYQTEACDTTLEAIRCDDYYSDHDNTCPSKWPLDP